VSDPLPLPRGFALRLHATQPLFAWSELEGSPSLKALRAVLASWPDQPLLDALRQTRGHGRDDYPLERLWGVVVLSVLCRHVWLNDCLAELGRNPAWCRLLGIRQRADIPGPHNLSRFLDLLGRPEPLRALRGAFAASVTDLVRAAVQGPNRGGAGQRAAEGLLGGRRRQCHRGAALSCPRRGGPGGPPGWRASPAGKVGRSAK
jgi:hypothetical protein